MASNIIIVQKKMNAPVAIVWQALTTATQMKDWYFAVEKFIAEPGFSFKMYGQRDGKFYPVSCCITEAKKNKLLSYTWSYDEYPTTTTVCFELTQKDTQTILKLTHTGLQAIPASFKDLSITSHITNWKNIIGKLLKDYVEQAVKTNL